MENQLYMIFLILQIYFVDLNLLIFVHN